MVLLGHCHSVLPIILPAILMVLYHCHAILASVSSFCYCYAALVMPPRHCTCCVTLSYCFATVIQLCQHQWLSVLCSFIAITLPSTSTIILPCHCHRASPLSCRFAVHAALWLSLEEKVSEKISNSGIKQQNRGPIILVNIIRQQKRRSICKY